MNRKAVVLSGFRIDRLSIATNGFRYRLIIPVSSNACDIPARMPYRYRSILKFKVR